MGKIVVKETEISVVQKGDKDYICLTDMAKNNGGNTIIQNWIRNKNTIEFLGIWETLYDPNFNSVEFHRIMLVAGVDRFIISPKQWIEQTLAIGIISKAGKYGGTYAHKDIAFEFGSWLSPEFKLLLIREFQRLKDDEAERLNIGWDMQRYLTKVNYRIHTDAIKENLIPLKHFPKDKEGYIYAEEAELLNFALFNQTSKEWKQQNPGLALEGLNIRDYADLHELIVLTNLESLNAEMVRKSIPIQDRLIRLREEAIAQLKTLRSSGYTLAKIQSPYSKDISTTSEASSFDKPLKIIPN